jgi:hypothetical protein
MKVFVLLSLFGLAAAQMNIQMPIEWMQQQAQWQWNQQNQPQENNWDLRRPVEQPQENNWDFRRPVEQPQQNNWDNRRPVEQPQQPQWNQPQQPQWNQPWDNSIPIDNNWRNNLPWNTEPIRVPPQPIETEPWLLRPETRCPQPQENSYSWALIIPHWRDQGAFTLCLGGVGCEFLFFKNI